MERREQPHSAPSDLKGTYEQCLRALFERDRLSHVGRLIRGLIHNINGPLQNISMLTEMLLKGLQQMTEAVHAAPENAVRSWGEFNAKQHERLERLVLQINALSEMQRDFMLLQEMEQIDSGLDLNGLLHVLTRIFSADLFFKHQVDLTLHLSEGLPLIRVKGVDLVPAFMHLFENALFALRQAPRKNLTIESRRENGSVFVIFRDSGPGHGMGDDTELLFRPFYSGWNGVTDLPKEAHAGFGLFFVRHRLEPYGVRTYLKREGNETLAVVEIPTTA